MISAQPNKIAEGGGKGYGVCSCPAVSSEHMLFSMKPHPFNGISVDGDRTLGQKDTRTDRTLGRKDTRTDWTLGRTTVGRLDSRTEDSRTGGH